MDYKKYLDEVLSENDYEAYGDYSYDEQNDLFLKFKKPFDQLNRSNFSDNEKLFPEYLEYAIILAINGNPVAQDFLTYIYKKGRTDIMKPNLLRSYEWGILACDNCSMLAIDRLKFFFNPAYEKIAENPKLQTIVEKFDLTDDIIEYFFAYNIANMMLSISDISLSRLSKEPIYPEDFTDVKIRELERIRDRVIENMLDLLEKS